jgi:hypothetical protein
MSKKYCYLARPMASYGIPGASMLPPELYRGLMDQGYTLLDPAFDLEPGDTKGKGMDPWVKIVQRHCDRLVVLISGNIVTSGVNVEIEAAVDAGLKIEFPYGIPNRSLSIRESVLYNSLGTFILSPTAKQSRFMGFTASMLPIDPRIPVIIPGQH